MYYMTRFVWLFWILALIGVALFVSTFRSLGYAGWGRPRPSPEPIYCAQDAMECPDGSYVGRVPPTCAFRACPLPVAFGAVSGRVSIGPLCPVEPCRDRPNPYVSRTLIFSPQSPFLPVGYGFVSSDGAFRQVLRAGAYTVRLWPCAEMGCRTALPQLIVVPADGEVQLTIDIDTGIR